MILEGYQEFFHGDNKPLHFKFWDADDPTQDVSAATVTVTLYGPGQTVALASGAMTTSGTTVLTCKRNFAPSSVSNAPGKYRAVAKVTYGGNVITVQWAVIVRAVPAPE